MVDVGASPILEVTWRVGQVAKTPPFHGGIMGSIPVRAVICFYRIKALRLTCNQLIAVRIRVGAWRVLCVSLENKTYIMERYRNGYNGVALKASVS